MQNNEIKTPSEREQLQSLDSLTELELVGEYDKVLNQLKALREQKSRIEFKADTLMRKRGATVLQGDSKELVKSIKSEYDKSKLAPLKELIPMEDLIRRKAYIPEWTEQVTHEEKWGNMTTIKTLSEYGQDISDIITNSVVEKTINYSLRDRR